MIDKELDREVDTFEAEVYLREFSKRSSLKAMAIFIPEAMEKYHQYMNKKEKAFIKAITNPGGRITGTDGEKKTD